MTVQLLNYIFPESKFIYEKDILYVEKEFIYNNSIEVLKKLDYKKVCYFDSTINLISNKRKRDNNIFNKDEWFSPSKIKLALDEPFKIMIKELIPDKINNNNPINILTMSKGNEYENYILDLLEKKLKKLNKNYNILKVCLDKPNLNDIGLIKKSYEGIKNGVPIIYQPILINPLKKMWGIPDFIIRSDIFIELFPNNKTYITGWSEKNNFNNNFYIVVDVKLARCKMLKNGELTNEKRTKLNKIQIYIYNELLSYIQGNIPDEFNYGFILGSKTIELKNNLISKGVDNLGHIKIENKIFEEQVINAQKIINEIRDVKDVRKLLRNKMFKPMRCKTNYFAKNEDSFSDIKKELGFYSTPKFTLDKSRCIELKKDLEEYNLVYVDFETMNLLLNLSCSEYQKVLTNDNTLVCQIGVYYNNIYKSFFSNSYNDIDIKNNFINFVNYLKVINNEKPMRIISWGNLEKSCYKNARKKYGNLLPELDILDLCNYIKKCKIFNEFLSLSLKKLIPVLNSKFKTYFPDKYEDLVINSGISAFVEIYNYYQCYDNKLKKSIEDYNKLDCLVMNQIINFLFSL